jgi:pimeloyl-ACP methyl ester carboxylesterase
MARANDRDLCYETFGRTEDPPLLLVMGLGAQLTAWPDELCQDLAARGHFVIRFDNRDVGLSSKTEGEPPDTTAMMLKVASGEELEPDQIAYDLSDMAADAVGLLDALGIERAHVVGASMGGMIVQHLAIEHPERLRSATSIMSSTGNSDVGQPKPAAVAALLRALPETREAMIEQSLQTSKIVSGPLWEEDVARRRITDAYDRMFHPPGAAFQMAAVLASGDRTERLGQVRLPFLVIHGKSDSLVDVSGGLATAEAVAGADVLLLHDMGHDLPRALVPQLAAAIDGFTRRVERS